MGAKIVQWVKANLMVVICGSLAVLSLTALVLGMIMPDAQSKLDADKSVFTGLESAARQPANEKTIEELRRKQNDTRRAVQRYMAEVGKSNPHTLIKWGTNKDAHMLFPTPRPDEPMAPNEFVDACAAKRRDLLNLLRALDRPSEDDVKEYKDAIDKARQRERMERGEAPTAGMTAPMGGMGMGSTPGPASGFGGISESATVIPENMKPEEWVKSNPKAGASIKRAHEIYCYANNESLDPRYQIPVGTRFPEVERMWLSQVSLWIQEDVVLALARLNNEVANTLPEQDRWVANLPIKHLQYIAIGDLVIKPGAAPAPGPVALGGAASGSGMDLSRPDPPLAGASFVKREGNDGMDAIPLAIGLVIDANYLVRVVDEIGRSGFFTPLLVNYEVAEPNAAFQDYIYGSAPIVRVRLEFEHYILRDKLMIGDKKYADLMPARIKDGSYVPPVSNSTPGAPGGMPMQGNPGTPQRQGQFY